MEFFDETTGEWIDWSEFDQTITIVASLFQQSQRRQESFEATLAFHHESLQVALPLAGSDQMSVGPSIPASSPGGS